MKTYKDINGWFSFESFYTNIATKYLKNNMVIAEVGVFDGKSACFLANYIKSNLLNIKFYAIDHWLLDEDYNRFIQNIHNCGVFNNIIPIRHTSEKAVTTFPDSTLDFVFIDGSHDYDSVKKDINMWYSKIKNGGIFGGDDYDPCWPGVIKAVDERFGNEAKKSWPVWYINK